jgi:hypothetical protein
VSTARHAMQHNDACQPPARVDTRRARHPRTLPSSCVFAFWCFGARACSSAPRAAAFWLRVACSAPRAMAAPFVFTAGAVAVPLPVPPADDEASAALPVDLVAGQIATAVRNNRVTLIFGATGSGKSTR